MFAKRAVSGAALRRVTFVLFWGDNVLLRGEFVVTATPGVSIFPDESSEVVVPCTDVKVGLFRGAIIRHELRRDGNASFEFQYFFVREDVSSPIGFAQDREFAAAIAMASDSVLHEWESVDVGDEYRLAFRSQPLRQA